MKSFFKKLGFGKSESSKSKGETEAVKEEPKIEKKSKSEDKTTAREEPKIEKKSKSEDKTVKEEPKIEKKASKTKEHVHEEPKSKGKEPVEKSDSKSIDVPKELHRYIVGTKGATIQDIQSRTNAKINIPENTSDSTTVTVTGPSESSVDAAIKEIQAIVKEHSGKKAPKSQEERDAEYKKLQEEHENESQETDKLYKMHQKDVDKHAQLRTQYFEEAEKEYANGNKDKARELREKAKEQTKLMEEAQQAASKAIFEKKNAKFTDKLTIDLHGLHTNDALGFLKERIEYLKKKGGSQVLCVIYGAGNHSDENGPKIKPLVRKVLDEEKVQYTEVNNGSINVTIA